MVCKKQKERAKGEGLREPCLVCGERRITDNHHFPKRKRKGEEGKETIPLCPTHHRLLETGRISWGELEAIRQARYAERFPSAEDFIKWACDNCYPYSMDDLRKKFWDYNPQIAVTKSNIERVLAEKYVSMLCSIDFGPSHFVVGAPHHAPGGVERLPFGKESDENVGFLSLRLAELLEGRCVVANRYWFDSNKVNDDYVWYVKQRNPKVFVEIHGHSGERSDNDLEISCGTDVREWNEKSIELANSIESVIMNRLVENIDDRIWDSLCGLKVEGDFAKIYFKATKAVSIEDIREKGGIPYHIEISRRLRKRTDNSVPIKGKALMDIIACSLRNLKSTLGPSGDDNTLK